MPRAAGGVDLVDLLEENLRWGLIGDDDDVIEEVLNVTKIIG